MTIPSTPRKAGPYTGNGVQTAWPFTFKVFAQTDVKVTVATPTGVESVLTLGAYTVTLNPNQETSPGGTINYLLPNGHVLAVTGKLPFDQPLDLPSGGNFSPLALENQLDRLAMQLQQVKEEVDRAGKVPITSDQDIVELMANTERVARSADNVDIVATNIASVNTVAADIADVNLVAASLGDGMANQPTTFDDYVFSGTGAQTAYTLTTAPLNAESTLVFIDGVRQVPTVDYTVSGTTLTFTSAPPLGTDNIAVLAVVASAGRADRTYYLPAGPGAVGTNVQSKLRESVSVKDFGAVGDGVTDDTAAVQAAFNFGGRIFFPDGTYFVTKSSLEALPDFGLKPANGSTIEWSRGAVIKLEAGVDVRHIVGGTNVSDVDLINCAIDGNNSACNGIGFSGATNFRVTGGVMRNIRSSAQTISPTPNLGGGRAITLQYNCKNVVVDGVQFFDCFTCVDIGGNIAGPNRAATVANIVAENCNVICSTIATDSTGLTSTVADLNSTSVVVSGVSFRNCGSSVGLDNRVNFSFIRQNSVGNAFPWMSPARTGTSFSTQDWLMAAYSAGDPEWNSASSYNVADRVKYTNMGLCSSLFVIEQTSGASISGVRGYNDSGYGKIGAIVRGLMKNVSVDDVVVSVDCEFIFRNGPVPVIGVTTRNFGRSQNIRMSRIDNLGTTDYIVGSDGPINVGAPLTPYYLQMESIGIQQTGNLGLVRSEMGTLTAASAATVWIQARNISNGGTIAGNPLQLVNRAITDCNSADPSGFKSVLAGALHIKQHQTNSQLRLERTGTSAGSSDLYANANGMNCIAPNFTLDTNGAGYRLKDSNGVVYSLTVNTSGKLLINGTIVGTQS